MWRFVSWACWCYSKASIITKPKWLQLKQSWQTDEPRSHLMINSYLNREMCQSCAALRYTELNSFTVECVTVSHLLLLYHLPAIVGFNGSEARVSTNIHFLQRKSNAPLCLRDGLYPRAGLSSLGCLLITQKQTGSGSTESRQGLSLAHTSFWNQC